MDLTELRARLRAEGKPSLAVKVVPKSRVTEWAGPLRVKLAAVPEKGKANDELIRFLAAEFEVPRANVEIVAGATNQRKQVRITKPA